MQHIAEVPTGKLVDLCYIVGFKIDQETFLRCNKLFERGLQSEEWTVCFITHPAACVLGKQETFIR